MSFCWQVSEVLWTFLQKTTLTPLLNKKSHLQLLVTQLSPFVRHNHTIHTFTQYTIKYSNVVLLLSSRYLGCAYPLCICAYDRLYRLSKMLVIHILTNVIFQDGEINTSFIFDFLPLNSLLTLKIQMTQKRKNTSCYLHD